MPAPNESFLDYSALGLPGIAFATGVKKILTRAGSRRPTGSRAHPAGSRSVTTVPVPSTERADT